MDWNRVTVRYAKAFTELASERGLIAEIDKDVRLLYYALDSFKGFNSFILKPGVCKSEKIRIIEELFINELNPITIKFLRLIIDNNRESFLKYILFNTIEKIRIEMNVVKAKLESAKEIDEVSLLRLKKAFENKINSTIEISSEVNPDLIGGFVFTIDGEQYDASISTKLNAMAKQLQIK